MPRRPDTPCTGGCGRLLWSGTGSLPAPERRCRECRRKTKPGPAPLVTRVCACGQEFASIIPHKRWCSTTCLARPPRSFPQKTKAERRGRYGRPYLRVRALVLAEESDCWVCGYPVDKARRFPDPWSATLDHVTPLCDGGAVLARENLRLAHFRCNRSRRS